MSCGKEHNEIACPFAALNEKSRLRLQINTGTLIE